MWGTVVELHILWWNSTENRKGQRLLILESHLLKVAVGLKGRAKTVMQS